MAAGLLDNPRLRLILFGGKGGCGKTTSATAASIRLAAASPEKRVLLVSTDPAHSLGDSFGCPVGGEAIRVEGVKNLWAVEVDAKRLLEEFKEKHAGTMKKLAERGTYFDSEDIERFFSLSLPGLDEVMAIIEVARILGSGKYDLVVLDTAPTGHTLRLLGLPAQMKKWISVFDMMQEKHRFLMKHYTGRYKKDDADMFLKMISDDLGRVESILKNAAMTEFVAVTVPEPMAIDETERMVNSLKGCSIPVRSIIINRVARDTGCEFCLSRKSRAEEYIKYIEERFSAYNLVKVPLFPREVRGMEGLEGFAGALFDGTKPPVPHREGIPGVSVAVRPCEMNELLEGRDMEFLLFGGKGGVGKTTVAASTALFLARTRPEKRILIFSTDPAHSLSDAFSKPIGDAVTPVLESGAQGGSLDALEIDAARLLEGFKESYRSSMEEVFDRFLAGGMDIKFDREVMTELMDLSPPGLDEIMALKKIMELRGSYDTVILDTAPTGHLIRFLETPATTLDWLRAVLRLIYKYREVVGLGSAAKSVLELTRDTKKIKDALTDPRKTEFIAVTIPEAMGIFETERLLTGLKRLSVPCRHIIFNMVIPPTECPFCIFRMEEEEKYLKKAKACFGDEYSVTRLPLMPRPVKGIKALTELCEVTCPV